MIDITGPKVLTPALLFALLSPGILLTLPSLKLFGGQMTMQSVLIHAVVLSLVYWIIGTKVLGVTMKPADLIVPAVLFILLSPGVLLTLPPKSGGVWMSRQTGPLPVAVHAVVFAVVFAFLRTKFSKYY